jgi:hypothetical protein
MILVETVYQLLQRHESSGRAPGSLHTPIPGEPFFLPERTPEFERRSEYNNRRRISNAGKNQADDRHIDNTESEGQCDAGGNNQDKADAEGNRSE